MAPNTLLIRNASLGVAQEVTALPLIVAVAVAVAVALVLILVLTLAMTLALTLTPVLVLLHTILERFAPDCLKCI